MLERSYIYQYNNLLGSIRLLMIFFDESRCKVLFVLVDDKMISYLIIYYSFDNNIY